MVINSRTTFATHNEKGGGKFLRFWGLKGSVEKGVQVMDSGIKYAN